MSTLNYEGKKNIYTDANPFNSRLLHTDKEGLHESSAAAVATSHTCNKPHSAPSFLLVLFLLVAIYCRSLGRQIESSFFKILPHSVSCAACLLWGSRLKRILSQAHSRVYEQHNGCVAKAQRALKATRRAVIKQINSM